MDEKQSQALANELAKNLKTPDDISQFERLLKKNQCRGGAQRRNDPSPRRR
ncbi:transposase [Erwinia tracheiphila PSU-1]|nr:transposase [Erwinia tracheiphila PSU-1]